MSEFSETEIKIATEQEWQEYYAALGQFMFEFATAEEEISRRLADFVIFKLLGLGNGESLRKQEIVRALMVGMRINSMKDTLKRLLRITDADDKRTAEVSSILTHLSDITALRDQLAHHASYPTMKPDGSFQTTNQSTSKEPMRIEWIEFTPAVLLDAAEDLHRIPYMLSFSISPDGEAEKRRLSESSELWRQEIEKLAQPWRYKPAGLTRTGPKHDHNPRWRSLPPEPSQA